MEGSTSGCQHWLPGCLEDVENWGKEELSENSREKKELPKVSIIKEKCSMDSMMTCTQNSLYMHMQKTVHDLIVDFEVIFIPFIIFFSSALIFLQWN